jgi:hypothetical protein
LNVEELVDTQLSRVFGLVFLRHNPAGTAAPQFLPNPGRPSEFRASSSSVTVTSSQMGAKPVNIRSTAEITGESSRYQPIQGAHCSRYVPHLNSKPRGFDKPLSLKKALTTALYVRLTLP